ncbi:GNAT family N-acetyltransferase [Belnapia sp. F-4-1]|uniref:GNAT family N-acetyltransferase n=1 Tax=Belnapia sp. F-4-1 TaxID=1545443 RepID=UPI00068B9558|nr:GNAT family N-acetyltransferase [Belnapia sp. F-4-1]
MRIEVITGLSELSRLRPAWDAVYDADPEAQFFLSWPWLSGRLQELGRAWFVLVARTGPDPSACVAFLPVRLSQVKRGDAIRRQLRMAGSPIADYTGFLCRPEHEALALAGFADALQRLARQLHWDDLEIASLRASDRRLRLFLGRFPSSRFVLKHSSTVNADGVDNAVCPYVSLPRSWDEYLRHSVSANTRQKLRRFLRLVEGSPDFEVVAARPETVEQDIGTLLDFWEAKWGSRKAGKMDRIRAQTRSMLLRCSEAGCLFLPTLRYQGRPVGALTILLDHRKRSYLFHMGGRDESFDAPPPGLCLHAFSIRHAIEAGFSSYDFLRGNEAYKFSFGAEPHLLRSLVLSPKFSSRLKQNSSGAADETAPSAA